jgi:hypothetical protein
MKLKVLSCIVAMATVSLEAMAMETPYACYDSTIQQSAREAWNDEIIKEYFERVFNGNQKLNDLVVTAWNICWNIQTFGKILDDNVFSKIDSNLLTHIRKKAGRGPHSTEKLFAAIYAINVLHDKSLTPDFYPWNKDAWKQK